MANVTVSVSNPTITVAQDNTTIAVSSVTSNVVVGQAVGTTQSNTIATSGRFESLSVGTTSIVEYTFPTDAPTVDQGLRALANGTLYWSTDVGLVDSVNGYTGVVVLDTDDINEGTTNQYYTDARADARVNLQTGTNLDLSSKTTTDLAEGTNLYWTTARGDSNFDTRLATKSTTDLTEGTNLYYTDARTQAALSVTTGSAVSGGSLAYDNSSGVFTFGPSTGIDLDTSLATKTTTDLAEGTNLYYTTTRANTDFDTRLATKTTTDVAEGTNLYYTDTRVDARLSSGAITSNIITTGGNISTTAHVVTNHLAPITGNTITVAGNMEVNGNLNVVEKVDLLLQDNRIVLNYGNAAARNAYITVDRSGSSLSNANISWNEAPAKWIIDNNTEITGSLTATSVVGPLTGDVTGNLTGDVTGDTAGTHTGAVIGNVTGDTAGTHTGAVVGNVTGDTAGTHTGAVIGDVTGNLTGDVTGNLTGSVTGTASLTTLTTTGNITSTGGNVAIGNPSSVFGLRNLKYDVNNNRLGLGTGDNIGINADGDNKFGALDILADNGTSARMTIEELRNSSTGPDFRFYKGRGTYAVPASVFAGDRIYENLFYAHDGTGYGSSRAQHVVFTDDRTGTGYDQANQLIPSTHAFQVKNTDNTLQITPLQIQGGSGNVMIGQTGSRNNGTAEMTITMAGNVHTNGDVHVNNIRPNTGSNVHIDTIKPITQFGDVKLNGNVNIATAEQTVNTPVTAAIDQIISSVNQGGGTDTIGISGQTGSGFDATQVVVSGIVDTGFTQVNGNTYYVKWDNINNAYGLYTDVALTIAVQVMTGGGYVGSPAGTPIITYSGGSSIGTKPANLTVAGHTLPNSITSTTTVTTNELTVNANATVNGFAKIDDGILPVTNTKSIGIGGKGIDLTQMGLQGDMLPANGGNLGSGIATWGQLNYQGLQPTVVNAYPSYNNVSNISDAYLIAQNTVAGTNTVTVTGYMKQIDYYNNPGLQFDTDTTNISTYMTNTMYVGQLLSSQGEAIGVYGDCGFNNKLVYITAIDTVARTYTTNANADRTITGGTAGYDGSQATLSACFYNDDLGVGIAVFNGVDGGTGSQNTVGFVGPISFNGLNANQLMDLDDLTLSTDLTRSDWTDNSTSSNRFFRGRNYWTIDKVAGDTTQISPIFRAQDGIVIGRNTELGNRPYYDTFDVNGINIGWDGEQDSIGGKRFNPATQIGMGAFNKYSSTLTGQDQRALNGPRVFLSAFEGDVNTPLADQYPRKDSEMGRVMAWGRSQSQVNNSTYNPPAKLSFWAEDFTGTNTLTQIGLIGNDGATGAKFLSKGNYENEGGITSVQAKDAVYLSPGNGSDTTAHNRPKAGYIDSASSTGSSLLATTGHNSNKQPAVEFGLERKTSLGQLNIKMNRGGEYYQNSLTATTKIANYYPRFSIGLAGDSIRTANQSAYSSAPEDWVDGLGIIPNGFSGAFGTAVNGNPFYAKLQFGLIFELYTDSAMTIPLNTGIAFGTNVDENNTGYFSIVASERNRIYNEAGGRSDKKYSWYLPNNNDDVIHYQDHSNGSGGTELYRYNSTTSAFDYSKPITSTQSITASSFIGNLTGAADTVNSIANFDTDALTEGSTNLYYTTTRANTDFDTRLATKSTSDVAEGTDLYYTDGRSRSAVSVATTAASGDGALAYNSGTGVFTFTPADSNAAPVDSVNGQTGVVVLSTNDIAENTNLYYTTARANSDFDTRLATKTTDNVAEGTNLYYTDGRVDTRFDTQLATKSTTDLAEGTNLYYTDARADARVNLQTGTNLDLSNQDTADLSEGTNLYYTDARVDARLSSGSVASISAEDTTLKKFQETTVALGSVSGDQSSAINLNNGSIYTMTLTGGLTVNSMANAVAGQSGLLIITQDGTGSRTITTGSNVKWAGGLSTLSTGFGSVDIINFMFDGTTYYFSLTKGYEAQ